MQSVFDRFFQILLLFNIFALLLSYENKTVTPIEVNDHSISITFVPPTNTNITIAKDIGDTISLQCQARKAFYYGNITWLKNNIEIYSSDEYNITSEDDQYYYRKNLTIVNLQISHFGLYECQKFTKLGSKYSQYYPINPKHLRDDFWWDFFIGLGCVAGILSIFSFILTIKLIMDYMKRIKLKKMGIEYFQEGIMVNFNPEMTICEQSELLPYVKKFEFPRKRLLIGKRLGSGAFGVVYQAEAKGILKKGKKLTVAVKTLTPEAGNDDLKALISELKIMQYLGKHLNVVNLLGSVTANLHKGELLVIVEFCKFGNVKHYVTKNRKRFVNQIDSVTDEINTATRFSKIPTFYDNPVCSTSSNSNHKAPESIFLTLDSQPLQNCEIFPVLTTTHLISWAFQIARGMDYLASRKILHGDLAARNVLLCDDNIVKICDFGLSKALKNYDTYKKTKNARLPVRWLALETLLNREFSVRSDVWSYGVTLWELFTLGESPYSNSKFSSEFVKRIENGYRLEKPRFANQIIYNMMTDCWNAIADKRPLFSDLEKRFAALLEDDLVDHYVKMNQSFIVENLNYFKNATQDYLSRFGVDDGDDAGAAVVADETNDNEGSKYENTKFLQSNFNVQNLQYFLELDDNRSSGRFDEYEEPKCLVKSAAKTDKKKNDMDNYM